MKLLRMGAVVGALMAAVLPVRAEYPEQAIQLVIPYGAGGATDLSARALANALSPVVDEPILLVNRTGAGGATGSVSVAKADGDGYTLLAARVGSHTVNPAMKATLPYTLDDFRFVGVYEINPVVCAVNAQSDIASMDDLVARIEAEPGTVTYSSSGVGTLLHIAAAMVLKSFGIEDPLTQAVHLPMNGGGQAATAVLAGNATFVCTNSSALASFIANGQLKPILVTTAEPLEGFDAPTATSLGHPELEQLVGWTGIAGPDDLSDEAAAVWGEWLAKAVEDEKFQSFMAKAGSQVRLMSPEDSVAFVKGQYEVFRKLVDDLGMRVE
ncbi:tripartite tricarboxylate transporter substrate binding protein [Kaustia mangrovi]|uniref:Tripartite tricarboxylate transporter substrate binding protein n=1 Tax=Kaustia mangrovi TaxID=2593653 RepID=A0A7S8C3W1_9HYPH|nr:tripartite tricarboxylate transporter substrate binding protein [Kaustia mangrovi]QPC42925.1 tripartite tricarboxylate transporter substrate binding protein [Kaustia mangrovi]